MKDEDKYNKQMISCNHGHWMAAGMQHKICTID